MRKGDSIIYGPLHYQIEEEQRMLFYRKKFYSNSNQFAAFEHINDEFVKRSQNTINELFPESEYPKNSLKRYKAVLKYLLDQKNNNCKSFDEKIVFLIQAIDPELSIYYYFLRCGYSQNVKSEENNTNANKLISYIKSVVGDFDVQFLKYEEAYFRKFLKCGDIISHVNSDYSSAFLKSLAEVQSFDDIGDIVFQILSMKTDEFTNNCEDPHNANTVCFNISNPNYFPEGRHPLYKTIFFIQTVDPELKALKIYEEESTISNIKDRMIEEFGFYNEDLVKIEKKYRKRFMPEQQVSEWSK